MNIYLDVIWFLNFCIDYLLLFLTAIILKRRPHHVRITLGAFVASLTVFFLFIPVLTFLYKPLMKLIYSAIIVLITFGFKRGTYFLQGFLMFYFTTFMTGGALFALHFFGQNELAIINGLTAANRGYFGSGISWLFVIIGFPLAWFFSKKRIETIEWKKIQYDQIIDVDINISGEMIRTRGLIDSGNQLTEPITKKPVMIIEAELLHSIFSEKSISRLITYEEELEDCENDDLYERVTIIPYRAVGQASAFLIGIKPDYVVTHYLGGSYVRKDVLLGLQEKGLSPDGAFNSIVHPSLVLGEQSDRQLA